MNTKKQTNDLRGWILKYLAAAAMMGQAQGAITLTSSVSFDAPSNRYTYSYTVVNTGPVDGILVSIPVLRLSDVMGVAQPAGFLVEVDSFSGLVNLKEDDDLFTDQSFLAGVTVPGFVIRSVNAPVNVSFEAFDIEGNEFSGTVAAPAPEPTTGLLAGLGLLGALRRKRAIHHSA